MEYNHIHVYFLLQLFPIAPTPIPQYLVIFFDNPLSSISVTICAWVWDTHWSTFNPVSDHIFNKEQFFLPSSYQLPINSSLVRVLLMFVARKCFSFLWEIVLGKFSVKSHLGKHILSSWRGNCTVCLSVVLCLSVSELINLN